MPHLIDLKNVSRTYQRGGESLKVLQQLDLEMEGGSFYALMGPSGSGKTTLLNLIGGLDQPDSGQVVVDGEDLATMTRLKPEWEPRWGRGDEGCGIGRRTSPP